MRHQPLVAVAHGSRDPRAAATVEDLLDLVRARGIEVVTSYLDHAPPAPAQALDALPCGEVVVLPLLLTAAYHSKLDIPRLLQKIRNDRPIRYGRTLGPHPLLPAALERRLAEIGVEPGPETAVVLASAGSSDPEANATIAGLAREWRTRRPWRDVRPAFASAALPTPAEAVRAAYAAGAERVVVASYFLAPGHFADKVSEESLAAGATAVSPVLGAAPEVADLVAVRYRQALAAPAYAIAV